MMSLSSEALKPIFDALAGAAAPLSVAAKLVKRAAKIANLQALAAFRPVDWERERRQADFDGARTVVDGLRGVSPRLECAFDPARALRPES